MAGEIKISVNQIGMMKHAIGYSADRVKRGKYRAYRNYYTAPNPVPGWEELVAAGIAAKRHDEKRLYYMYRLTEAGIAMLADIIGIRIVEEE